MPVAAGTTTSIIQFAGAIIAIVGIPASWIWGGKQRLKQEREKNLADAETAAQTASAAKTTAAAQQSNADAALMNFAVTGGQETLRTLYEGAKAYQELLATVQTYSNELATMRNLHSLEIAALKEKHAEDVNSLRLQVTELSGKLALLEHEIAVKNEQISGFAETRQENGRLKQENAELRIDIERHIRANGAVIYLLESAANNWSDSEKLNDAQRIIWRLMRDLNQLRHSSPNLVADRNANVLPEGFGEVVARASAIVSLERMDREEKNVT